MVSAERFVSVTDECVGASEAEIAQRAGQTIPD
jgi:hypothetical protein